jgi:hypothetical protein
MLDVRYAVLGVRAEIFQNYSKTLFKNNCLQQIYVTSIGEMNLVIFFKF